MINKTITQLTNAGLVQELISCYHNEFCDAVSTDQENYLVELDRRFNNGKCKREYLEEIAAMSETEADLYWSAR